MKVWELEEGKEYKTELKLARFKVVNDILFFYDILNEEWKESTRDYNDIVKCDFTIYTPPTDWSKVKVDTKVLVRDWDTQHWVKRYFIEYKNGRYYVFKGGRTSFTTENEEDYVPYNQAKLYTE